MFRETLGVNNHSVAAARGTCGDGNLGERIPGLVPLFSESGDDTNGGIVLIQGGGELFACALQLFIKVVCLESHSIPFVLESGEEGGDGG